MCEFAFVLDGKCKCHRTTVSVQILHRRSHLNKAICRDTTFHSSCPSPSNHTRHIERLFGGPYISVQRLWAIY